MKKRIIIGSILGMTWACLAAVASASNTGWEVKAGKQARRFHEN